jgi:hypothetical protein
MYDVADVIIRKIFLLMMKTYEKDKRACLGTFKTAKRSFSFPLPPAFSLLFVSSQVIEKSGSN